MILITVKVQGAPNEIKIFHQGCSIESYSNVSLEFTFVNQTLLSKQPEMNLKGIQYLHLTIKHCIQRQIILINQKGYLYVSIKDYCKKLLLNTYNDTLESFVNCHFSTTSFTTASLLFELSVKQQTDLYHLYDILARGPSIRVIHVTNIYFKG